MFNNSTKNQHYIAQVEQKLNAINPKAKRERRKIFEYKIVDRELDTYQKTKPYGVEIEHNLSFNDLYTFEIFDDKTRNNFEIFFNKYENKIENLTNDFINKSLNSAPITENDFFELFTCKFINFLRNPFSIKKIINTYSNSLNYYPLDSNLKREFDKINAENPLIASLSLDDLNISQGEYINWLKIIFINLAIEMNGESITKNLMQILFNKENKVVLLKLNLYDDEICLLSDRGYVDQSMLFPEAFCMSFNLTKSAFITVITLENTISALRKVNLGLTPCLEALERNGLTKMEISNLDLVVEKNNLDMLSAYNSTVRYQCHKNFYSAHDTFL